MPNKGTFDVEGFLASQGAQFKGVNPDGSLSVVSPDGEEGTFDLKGFAKANGVNPDEVEFKYNSPNSALSRSIVSDQDRLRYSVGNERGIVKDLRTKFEDVAKNEAGELVVKKDGVWSKVDGDAFRGVDPWTATKGIMGFAADKLIKLSGPQGYQMAKSLEKYTTRGNPTAEELDKELADNAPMLAAMGLGAAAALAAPVSVPTVAAMGSAGAGTTALAAGGAVAKAGAIQAGVAGGVELMRSSLGRLANTYDATPEEQIEDAGKEMLCAFGGTVIPLGVKPGKEFFAKHIAKMGQNYAKMGQTARESLKGTYGVLTGNKTEHIDTVAEFGDEVAGVFKRVGGTDASFVDNVHLEKIGVIKQTADLASDTLNEVWRKNQAALLKAAPKDISADVGNILRDVHTKSIIDDFAGLYAPGGSRPLSKQAALDMIAENGGLIPKGFRVKLLPQKEIILRQQQNGLSDTAKIALDDDSYKMLEKFWKQIDAISQVRGSKGRRVINDVLTANGVLDDITYRMRFEANEKGATAVANKMAEYHGQIRGAVEKAFDKVGVGDQFRARQANYNLMKDQFGELLQAANRARKLGSDQPYLNLLNKLSTKPGRQGVAKDSFNGALKVASEMGASTAPKIGELQHKLRILDAAEAFYPVRPTGFVATAAGGTFIGGAATGNLPLALGTAATVAARSPRMAMQAQLATQATWEHVKLVQNLLASPGKKAFNEYISNPALIAASAQAIQGAATTAQQTEQELLSPLAAPGGQ